MNCDAIDLAKAEALSFIPYVGETFHVSFEEGEGPETTLVLKDAACICPGEPRPFSLIFEGPADMPLPQRTYWLSNSKAGVMPIFMVPIREQAEIRTYEAVFN